jgi:hypothetical protein
MKIIKSKNILGADGFTVGGNITKDMEYDVCPSLDSAYAPNGIAISDNQSNASYWVDWGNDVFDDWGYFYIFNTTTNEYYFPQITPMNLSDEIISTQTFTAFGRNFTIKQGYPAQGIFKFEISCRDSNFEFIFGAYGNMGADGDEINTNSTQNYQIGSDEFTLFYNKYQEDGDNIEILYSYFVPFEKSLNNSKTYNEFVYSSDLSLYSVPVKRGITVYFSKQNDVKDWVINDLGLYNVPRKVKINQRQTFLQSLTQPTAWKGFQYYQSIAVKYGFVRLNFSNYKKIYNNYS